MENLKLVAIPELIDLLAEHTACYLKMLSTGASHDEFEKCRERITALQEEIGFRKKTQESSG